MTFYLEVKIGFIKTPHFENNWNPKWNQVLAISKDRLQSSVLEVAVKSKDIENANNGFMGRVLFDLNSHWCHSGIAWRMIGEKRLRES